MTKIALRMNLLCYIGLVIGLFSCFQTWGRRLLLQSSRTQILSWNAIDALLSEIPKWWNDTVEIACVLFAAGLIISIVSPLGGVVQLIGVALFLENPYPSQLEGYDSVGTIIYETGIGCYLAVVSTILVLISLAIPVWLNFGSKHNGKVNRFIAADVGGIPTIHDSLLPAQKSRSSRLGTKAVAVISAAKSVLSRFRFRKYALRINVLCLIGAAVGFISLLLPWYVVIMEDHWAQPDYTQPGLITIRSYWLHEFLVSGFDRYSDYDGVAGALLFLIGTVLLIWSPWGAAVQVCGLVAFQQSVFVQMTTIPEINQVADTVHIGFFFGFFSSAFGLISMLRPIGPGYECEANTMSMRLTVWGKRRVCQWRVQPVN